MDPGQAPYTDPDKQVPHNFQGIGPASRVLQLNVEGLSAAKRQLIGTIAQQHKVDVICLQETHVAEMTAGRYGIVGYDLLSAAVPLTSGRLSPTQLPLHRTNSTMWYKLVTL